MNIRSILAVLDGGGRDELALKASISLAEIFAAHIEVLHVEPLLGSALPAIGEPGVSRSAARTRLRIEPASRSRTHRAPLALLVSL